MINEPTEKNQSEIEDYKSKIELAQKRIAEAKAKLKTETNRETKAELERDLSQNLKLLTTFEEHLTFLYSNTESKPEAVTPKVEKPTPQLRPMNTLTPGLEQRVQ